MKNKATSTKAKNTTKRGRPRIKGQLREPNGRVSRAKDPAAKLALEMRIKHYGLSKKQALDPRAESHLGRLALKGQNDGISGEQYDAALQFLNIRNEYRKALLSPAAYYEKTGMAIASNDLEEYGAWVKRATQRYQLAFKAVEEAQFDNSHENLYAALQYVIIENRNFPHLLGGTRMVLNALQRHFQRGRQTRNKSDKTRISLANMARHKTTLAVQAPKTSSTVNKPTAP